MNLLGFDAFVRCDACLVRQRVWCIFLLTIWPICGTSAERPERVLLEFLAKPFAPTWASDECLRDSAIYLKELAGYAPWALQMYDASVKIPPGLITGNYQQLGNYDECLQVKTKHGFIGQACSATVQFEIAEDNGAPREPDLGDLLLNVAIASNATRWTSGNSVVYEWMWCVPSSCNHSEIQDALEIALDGLKIDGRVDMVVSVAKESCHTIESDQPVLDVTDWIYITILLIFVVLVTVSTCYDIANQGHLRSLNRKDTKHIILTSFSFYTNGKNLLRTDRHKDAIECLDGLRYISICWIIYGHTHYTEVVGVKMNLTEVPRMHINWSNMLVLNGNIVTDTFFLISGILLAYTAMTKKGKDTNWHFDVMDLYAHRYLRLTPAYAMMIGFYATIFYKFGNGPHWDAWVGSNRDFCRENWWTNLLYVNNYVNVPTMCMSHSWYLATDMQLVWLSPIFLYPMLRFSRGLLFWLVFTLALFISVLLPFLTTFIFKLTGTMFYYKEQMMVANVYKQIYTRVYNRFGPYIIGLALGYVLYKCRSRAVKIPAFYVICGWIVAIVAGLSVVFGPRRMYFEDYIYDRIEASFYAGCHRQVFALAVSWIIFCSVHGYAGFVGQFLSWRGWVPLSRLSYSAYLCHYIFLLSDAGSVRTVSMLTRMGVIRTFFGNLCLTMLLSVVWSLCFEIPFMTLDRTLLSRVKRQSRHSMDPNSGKMMSSTDSAKEIYRSTEETSSIGVNQSYNEHLQGKSSDDRASISGRSISFQEEIDARDEKRMDKDFHGNNVGRRGSYTVYVIGSTTDKNDSSMVAKINGKDPCDYVDVSVKGDFEENRIKDTSKTRIADATGEKSSPEFWH